VTPDQTYVARTATPGTVVLKSFGKFWGLAGLRLGFAILAPGPVADRLRESLGPWSVSGPALSIGAAALSDPTWAEATRARLVADAARLDALLTAKGARLAGGTTLFRLYEVDDAPAWADRLASARILARVFPYSRTWLRLGLPAPDRWARLEAAL
jgi:cobalamin biosynthetic protein CobC